MEAYNNHKSSANNSGLLLFNSYTYINPCFYLFCQVAWSLFSIWQVHLASLCIYSQSLWLCPSSSWHSLCLRLPLPSLILPNYQPITFFLLTMRTIHIPVYRRIIPQQNLSLSVFLLYCFNQPNKNDLSERRLVWTPGFRGSHLSLLQQEGMT